RAEQHTDFAEVEPVVRPEEISLVGDNPSIRNPEPLAPEAPEEAPEKQEDAPRGRRRGRGRGRQGRNDKTTRPVEGADLPAANPPAEGASPPADAESDSPRSEKEGAPSREWPRLMESA